jgi:hypothetical protein
MKKSLVLVAGMIMLTGAVFSQHVNFGIKAGYNSSSVKVEDGVDYDSKSGLHFGGLAHIHINRQFAVQPELVFSCQGGEDGDAKLKLNYLNIPVLLQYMINNGFRLQTGPQLGFLLSAKQKFGDVTVDVDDIIKSTDFSWVFGAGYIFTSGIGIDARFNLGLTDISEDSDFEARNRVFQVGLFYQFKGGTGRRK